MKKIIKIYIFLMLIMIFSCKSYASSELIKFDVSTGEQSVFDWDDYDQIESGINLINNNNNNYSPNSIFGLDTRTIVSDTTVSPYSAVCKYTCQSHYDDSYINGTCFLVSKNVAVAAAHLVYSTNSNGLHYNMMVYPGYNNGYAPFGSSSIKTVYVPNEYLILNGSNDYDEYVESLEYDWAIIVLNSDLGNSSGYLSMKKYTNITDYYGLSASIIGYPKYIWDSDMNRITVNGQYQYCDSGTISTGHTRRLEYTIDTSSGQSGSPILNSLNQVIGVHRGETADLTSNMGIRFYDNFYSQVVSVIFSEMIDL